MQTVLLADDERVFKALEGTCLRRDVCRLVKTPAGQLADVAAAQRPDLIVLALDQDETRRAFGDLRGRAALSSIPIVALDFDPSVDPRRIAADDAARKGVVERLAVRKKRSGDVDVADLDRRLDESIKRHLPILNRKIDRVVVSVPVRCQGERSTFTLRTKNISPSGLFLKTERDLSPGDRIRVRFELPADATPDRPERITATCQVVRRVGPGGENDLDLIPGIGVRFLDLEDEGRTAIRRFVRTPPTARTAGSLARRTHAAH